MAPVEKPEHKIDTRHFNVNQKQANMPLRQTNALDLKTPTALRFVLDDMAAVFDVQVRSYMVIGRKDTDEDRQVDVDFAPFDGQRNGVSRYHAIIQIQNSRISIKDFNSSNGTYLNGFNLKPMFAYRLRHGDELVLGRMKMTVHFLGQV